MSLDVEGVDVDGRARPSVLFEEKLIYFPSTEMEARPETVGLAHEELALRAEDGVRLHGWYLEAPVPHRAAPVVLFCHGNAGNISSRLDRVIRMHAELGVDVLLFDYRGFGRSEGRPSEEGTYLDALAAFGYLVEARGVDPARLVFFGESLGAAVAIELSLREASGALVLEAPFTSIRAMARVAYPLLPLGAWVRTRYDNLSKISRVDRPLLVIHGTRDPTVPFAQGEELFRAAAEPKTFLAVEGGGHADAYLSGGEAYWTAWRQLLRSVESASCFPERAERAERAEREELKR